MNETPTGNYSERVYTYGDSEWGDKLTAYNGNAFTYDTAGNPTTYYNGGAPYTFGWEGRNLVYASVDGKVLTFAYNDEGLRVEKKIGDVAHHYYYHGSQLIADEWNKNILLFLYDENGSPIGMRLHKAADGEDVWSEYWYETNLQGDIIAVYNSSGTVLVTYTYDAWGRSTMTYRNGGRSTGVVYNPLRYRGYYYDSDTRLYYLQSRYYDPLHGRFLNADSTDYLDPASLTGVNLFTYCGNNPVNRTDPDGEFWHIVIGAGIGFLSGFINSVALDMIKGKDIDLTSALISGGIGAIEGGLSAAGAPLGVLIAVNAGLSAAESVYSDITGNEEKTTGEIVANALFNAGLSALFTLAGGSSSEMNDLYKDAKKVLPQLAKGMHPDVKRGARKTVAKYTKALGKYAKECGISALFTTPASTFISEMGKECSGRLFGR